MGKLSNGRKIMHEWATIFLILAGSIAIFAFTGIAPGYAPAAQVIFYLLLSISLFAFIAGLFPKKKTYSKRLVIDIK